MKVRKYRNLMIVAQTRMSLRTIRVNRTIFTEENLVLTNVQPVHLLTEERIRPVEKGEWPVTTRNQREEKARW